MGLFGQASPFDADVGKQISIFFLNNITTQVKLRPSGHKWLATTGSTGVEACATI